METPKKLIRFDWFIKKMLRNKSDFRILEGFLSALLKNDVTILHILESEGNQNTESQKYNRVDILIETDTKEKVIVEIQNDRESDYLERVLFGASKLLVEYLPAGEKYANISKVISVSILYFNLGQGSDYVYHGTTEFTGIHTQEKLIVKTHSKQINPDGSEKLTLVPKRNIFPEYFVINVERFDDVARDDLDEWIYMLKNSEIKKEFRSKYIQEAGKHLDFSKLSPQEKRSYEQHVKTLVIERDIMETARLAAEAEGLAKGKAEGKAEGKLEVAKNALLLGLTLPQIAALTSMSQEDLEKILSDNQILPDSSINLPIKQ